MHKASYPLLGLKTSVDESKQRLLHVVVRTRNKYTKRVNAAKMFGYVTTLRRILSSSKSYWPPCRTTTPSYWERALLLFILYVRGNLIFLGDYRTSSWNRALCDHVQTMREKIEARLRGWFNTAVVILEKMCMVNKHKRPKFRSYFSFMFFLQLCHFFFGNQHFK